MAAILTPPDPITQIGLALPLLLLYEISIFTVKFVEKIMLNIKDIRSNQKSLFRILRKEILMTQKKL